MEHRETEKVRIENTDFSKKINPRKPTVLEITQKSGSKSLESRLKEANNLILLKSAEYNFVGDSYKIKYEKGQEDEDEGIGESVEIKAEVHVWKRVDKLRISNSMN